jgi:hypothetical protein
VAENLPLGAVDALRPTASSIAPDAYATNIRSVFPLDQYLVGKDKVLVVVRPKVR